MFITPAYAQAAGPEAPSALVQLAPLVFIFVIFYFLLIRPQQQARKKHEDMVNNVRRGDQVVTAGGLYGKVTKVLDSGDVLVEVADGVVLKVVKATLSNVLSKTDPNNDK
ncbi:MAG: preprotein translocase subunit YajC [Pseudomonadota bacterium]